MDVARTAVRHGCEEVHVISNKEEGDIAARDIEVEFAKIDGVEFLFEKSTVAFVDEGVLLADSQITTDASGQKTVTPIAGTEQLFEADAVIIAIGQGPRAVIVSSTKGIDVTERGLVCTDENGHTSREGVFAVGDVVTGAKSVVEAVKCAKTVAHAMDAYMRKAK